VPSGGTIRYQPTKASAAAWQGFIADFSFRRRSLKRTYSGLKDDSLNHVVPRTALGHFTLAQLTGSDIDAAYDKALKSGRRDGRGGLSGKL
jgi:hypothetical protein